MSGIANLVIVLIVFPYFIRSLDKAVDIAFLLYKKNRYLQALSRSELSLEDLYYLTPMEFEEWSARFLQKMGYNDINVTSAGPDGGKDIICSLNGEKVYVECKRYALRLSSPFKVNPDIVRRLVGAMPHDNISKGIIITTGIITDSAKACLASLPDGLSITVFDGHNLVKEFNMLPHNERLQTAGT